MYAQVEKFKENKNQAIIESITQKKSFASQVLGFRDNRKSVNAQPGESSFHFNSNQPMKIEIDPGFSNLSNRISVPAQKIHFQNNAALQLKTILESHNEGELIVDKKYSVELFNGDESCKKILTYKGQGKSGFFLFWDDSGKNY